MDTKSSRSRGYADSRDVELPNFRVVDRYLVKWDVHLNDLGGQRICSII